MSDAEAPDLDAELLALADGDSSDEESTPLPPAKSPSPALGKDGARNSSTNINKSRSRKTKRSRNDDSEEEGEASSGSDRDSIAMDESDAGVGSPGSDTSGPMFPLENKYYSDKDKAEVLAMPEVQREAVLAERAALVERQHQDNILKRLYEGYKEKGEKESGKKRKAGTADLEEGDRKSSRQRTLVGGRKVGETNSAMEAYKAQREQKGILAEQRKLDAADRKAGKGRRRSTGESDVDADGESEVEWDDTKPKPSEQPRYDELADLSDFNRVKIGRNNFALVCFYPNFETTMRDCYVRIHIGDKAGEPLYRMAKIVGINEGRPYAMEGKNGKKFITRQYVRVTIGKTEREYPFLHCSMSRFEQRELDSYKAQMATDGHLMPKRSLINNKIDAINALVGHRFTEAELQEKLKLSGVLQQKAANVERTTLFAKQEEAERRGDEQELEQITARLKELEPPKLAFGTTLSDRNDNIPRGPTQQERLAELNRSNRKANSEAVRRALIFEKRQRNKHRVKKEGDDTTPQLLSTGSTLAPDSRGITPSSRGTTPVSSQSKDPSATATKTQAKGGFDWAKFDPLAEMGKAASGGGVDEEGKKKSVFKRKMCDDEILANMDFGLDLDIEVL